MRCRRESKALLASPHRRSVGRFAFRFFSFFSIFLTLTRSLALSLSLEEEEKRALVALFHYLNSLFSNPDGKGHVSACVLSSKKSKDGKGLRERERFSLSFQKPPHQSNRKCRAFSAFWVSHLPSRDHPRLGSSPRRETDRRLSFLSPSCAEYMAFCW